MEGLLDRYLPLTEEQKKDCDSDISVSNVSDASCVRINRSVVSIMTRPFAVFSVFLIQLSSVHVQDQLVAAKTKILNKAKPILQQVNEKLAPTVTVLTQTSMFKKVAQKVVACSEKTLGKDKTTTLLSKADAWIPAKWKAAPPPAATNGSQDAPPPVATNVSKAESSKTK